MSLTSDLNPSPRRVELHYHIHHKWMCDRTGTPRVQLLWGFHDSEMQERLSGTEDYIQHLHV